MVNAIVGNGQQIRMSGGWKGLPLLASHWPAMTTFSPEAPPLLLRPSIRPAPLLSHPPSLPPSALDSLPLLLGSCHPHHNRSISYSLSNPNLGEISRVVVVFLSFFPTFASCSAHGFLPGVLSVLQFPSLSKLPSAPSTSAFSSSALHCWLAISLTRYLSHHHLDLCIGDTPASC